MKRFFASAFLLGALVWLLYAITYGSEDELSTAEPPADPAIESVPGSTPSIERSAATQTALPTSVFEPYDRRDFPKLFERLGAASKRIQPLREGAAKQAMSSGRCDAVEYSEISDASTRSELVAFVDCSNGERFVVKESELSSNNPLRTQSDKVIGRGEAILACAEAAKSMATFPSTVDAHVWAGAAFSSHATTGNAQVLLDFDAQNGFGQELPFRARCVFPAGSNRPEITVQAR